MLVHFYFFTVIILTYCELQIHVITMKQNKRNISLVLHIFLMCKKKKNFDFIF